MPDLVEGYISTKISQFLITLIGMKRGTTKREQLLMDGILLFAFVTVLIAMCIENADLIYSRNDLYDYNELDKAILDKCDTTSAIGMSIMTLLGNAVIIHYLMGPYWDALGTNTTERVLPLRVVFNLPVTVTPYYETLYGIEVITGIGIGVLSVAFASYLFHTCIFVSGHFKILQRELENVCEVELEGANTKSWYNNNETKLAYKKLKKCVVQHELLIWYLGKLESLFCYILLMLILCSIIILCFSAFQIFLGNGAKKLHRQLLSVELIMASFAETALFAFSWNEILDASAAIGEAAYRCKWYDLPCDENGRVLKQGLAIMAMWSYKLIDSWQNLSHDSASGRNPLYIKSVITSNLCIPGINEND